MVALVVGAGAFYMVSNKNEEAVQMEEIYVSEDSMAKGSSMMMESSDSAATEDSIKEFVVDGSNFKFEPSEIRVNEGDTVKVKFKNLSGHHDFVIDEFNVATAQTDGPSEETVTFVADKTGVFEYYCSVFGHKQLGMKGSLVVE